MSKDAPVNVFSLGMPSNASGLGRLIRLQVPHEEEGPSAQLNIKL
jgi:hypothetical protein